MVRSCRLSKALTPQGVFFIFAGVNLLAMLFVFTSVPETKGRSLEEIEADVASRKKQSLLDCCRYVLFCPLNVALQRVDNVV